jgi:hypothetical protein
MDATASPIRLAPDDRAVGFFVREPFPRVATGTSLRSGRLENKPLRVLSQMNEGGVIFADGIEQDVLAFDWGCLPTVGVSGRRLCVVKSRRDIDIIAYKTRLFVPVS